MQEPLLLFLHRSLNNIGVILEVELVFVFCDSVSLQRKFNASNNDSYTVSDMGKVPVCSKIRNQINRIKKLFRINKCLLVLPRIFVFFLFRMGCVIIKC